MSHLTPEQIEQLRQMLTEKLARLRGFQTSVMEENPVNNLDRVEENESGDEAVEEYGILAAETLTETSDSMIIEIEAALERIAAGTYGLDEKTGEPIPLERLMTIPEARTSVAEE